MKKPPPQKTKLTFSQFAEEFSVYDKQDTFSPEALKALFQWLRHYEHNFLRQDEELEINIPSLCREFTEYSSIFEDVLADYPFVRCMDDLHQHTEVIPFGEDSSFLIKNF